MRNTKLPLLVLLALFLYSCQKDISKEPAYDEAAKAAAANDHGHLVQTKAFPDDVAEKWLDMELRLQWAWSGNPYGLNGDRFFAYLGVALYESVVNGMPAYLSLEGQLNGMPDMPETQPGVAYYWPAAANASLAYLVEHFYTRPESALLLKSADSLEAALNAQYAAEVDAATLARSVAFGTEVAKRIFEWSKTDNAANAACTFTPTGVVGDWTNVALNGTSFTAFVPCWGQNRLFVAGSLEGTYSPLPPEYSTDPNSPYYAMVKEVYDVSKTLTDEQKALAKYFLDQPGYPSGTQYISIFRQVVGIEDLNLAETAVDWAKLGLALADAQIGAWREKYAELVDRPFRYIRQYIDPTWTPLFATPPYPEFPAGHPQTAGAFGAIMESIFGTDYALTLHTYDVLGLAPISFDSFDDLVAGVGWARVYSGIHYTYTVVESSKQGAAIATNILELVDFHKGEGKP